MIRVQSLGRDGGDSRVAFFVGRTEALAKGDRLRAERDSGGSYLQIMQIQTLIGKKIDQTQGFLEDGTRVPLSIISVGVNIVSQIKLSDKEGYNAVQIGFGTAKKVNKPIAGHIKKAGIEKSSRFFREVRVDEAPTSELGSIIPVAEVFEPGDIVDVTGTSKGKGYAGVVKRHGFRGGPRTHGQSDRERAPGSIGQTTTPGRVYRGKRMAGRMGNAQVTIKNLEVLNVQGDTVLVRGLIPGVRGAMVMIKKVGKNKKFIPLWSEKPESSEKSENSENQSISESANQPAGESESKNTEVVVQPEQEIANAQTVSSAAEVPDVSETADAPTQSDSPSPAEVGSEYSEKEEVDENAGK